MENRNIMERSVISYYSSRIAVVCGLVLLIGFSGCGEDKKTIVQSDQDTVSVADREETDLDKEKISKESEELEKRLEKLKEKAESKGGAIADEVGQAIDSLEVKRKQFDWDSSKSKAKEGWQEFKVSSEKFLDSLDKKI